MHLFRHGKITGLSNVPFSDRIKCVDSGQGISNMVILMVSDLNKMLT